MKTLSIAQAAVLCIVSVLAALVVVHAPGCSEPEVTVTKEDGTTVTAPISRALAVLERESADAKKSAAEAIEAERRAAEAEARKAEAEAKTARAEAQREALKLQAKADAAGVELKAQLADLQIRTDTSTAELAQRASEVRAEFLRRVDAITTAAAERADAIKREREAAEAEADRIVAQRLAVFNVVKPLVEAGASAVPGGGALAGVLGTVLAGVGGLGAFGWRRAKAEAAEARDAHAADLTAMSRVIDSIDVLRRTVPAVEQAIRQQKTDLDEWQGEAGKALVDRLQKGQVTP